VLVVSLVGHYLLLVRDFGPYVVICMNGRAVICGVLWLSFIINGFWHLWNNIITAALIILLNEALSCLYAALWKQCNETRNWSLICSLICTCTSSKSSKRGVHALKICIFRNHTKTSSDFNVYITLCCTFQQKCLS
jgi:hypothetical protein